VPPPRTAPQTSIWVSALCIDVDLPSKWPVTKQQPNPNLRLLHDEDVGTITHPEACPYLLCPCMRLPFLCFGKRSETERSAPGGGP
jgi:hypothetical protein